MKLAAVGVFIPQKPTATNQASPCPKSQSPNIYKHTLPRPVRTKRRQEQKQQQTKNVNNILETNKADEEEVINLAETIKPKASPQKRKPVRSQPATPQKLTLVPTVQNMGAGVLQFVQAAVRLPTFLPAPVRPGHCPPPSPARKGWIIWTAGIPES